MIISVETIRAWVVLISTESTPLKKQQPIKQSGGLLTEST